MKRFLSVALAITMILSMAACGTPANSPAQSPSSQSKMPEAPVGDTTPELSGEITYSTWGSLDEKKVNEEVIAAFEAKYPGTKINLEYIPEDYVPKIDTMFMGGNAPDVIYGHPHYFAQWADQGLLMDLTDRFNSEKDFYFNDKFVSSIYDAFRWNDKYIATINGHDTFVMFYNKTLFDAEGLSYPDDTWTWDTWIQAAQKLTKKTADGNQYAFVIPSFAPDLLSIVYGFGGNVFDNMNKPTKVVFNSPETVAALTLIQDLVHKYKVAPDYQQSNAVGGGFEGGRIAMDITGCWAPVGRKNITDFKWDMANIPLAPGKENARRTSALFAGYAINAKTKNPELAYQFARFFQDDEGQEILSKFGLITVINSDIASKDENLKGNGFPDNHILRVTSIDYGTNGYAFLTNWQEMISKALQPNFDQLVANKMTPADCAAKVQVELEALLAEAISNK